MSKLSVVSFVVEKLELTLLDWFGQKVAGIKLTETGSCESLADAIDSFKCYCSCLLFDCGVKLESV